MVDVERYEAPGGVVRMVIGFACGLAVGAVIALILPRDDGPRRRPRTVDASRAEQRGPVRRAPGPGPA